MQKKYCFLQMNVWIEVVDLYIEYIEIFLFIIYFISMYFMKEGLKVVLQIGVGDVFEVYYVSLINFNCLEEGEWGMGVWIK